MLSNKQAKLIRSLQRKKQRDLSGLYIIEGDKLVKEYLEAGEEIVLLAGKAEWLSSLPSKYLDKDPELVEVSYDELKKISSLSSPHNSLAVVKAKKDKLDIKRLGGKLTLALDFIQDPGNLGTIIRTAAWFGIKNIICSKNCVDVYNPKVIQASMGALLACRLYYLELEEALEKARSMDVNIYAATLDGRSMYEEELSPNSIILFGNESTGVSDKLLPYVSRKIIIPFGEALRPGVESLNIATSAAIICSEFTRRNKKE